MNPKSINFEFLRPKWPELAGLAGFAEQYAEPDPASAAVKLRTFCEQTVDFLFHTHGLAKPIRPNLNDLLECDGLKQATPRVVLSKLHALRITGNHAAHGAKVSPKQTLYLLKEAFDLGSWLSMTYAGTAKSDLPSYDESNLHVAVESKQQLKREKKAVLQRLAAQEVEMQRVLADLETARKETAQAEATAEELRESLNRGNTAATALDFDEATTRKRLIDTMIAAAGWTVDPEGRDTVDVRQELEVDGQPTDTGIGYVDYVLWDDETDKPLAVIEAKKTSVDPERGRTQAKLYADALMRKYGQRPVIFYTNGFETMLWNDADQDPTRRVYGIYAKDSLRYTFYRRANRQPAAEVIPSNDIIPERLYQVEAVKRVIERFADRHRRALIVQATGTGKTRVAIALCDALVRANWAKRVLFLCDRRELRRQAGNAFKDFMPGSPRTVVGAKTAEDRDSRIYLATYPAMMRVFETFDPGFFDLIIADESHRSIYNRYRDIFLYFDGIQVGLTATPVQFVSRNTFKLFGCEDKDPTAHFSYNDAINHVPPYLVPFRVHAVTTEFQDRGIKYSQMNEDQRRQLEEDEIEPEAIEYQPHQIDRQIFNKDSNRIILRNLMDHGIRVGDGQRLGKTIVFARNHNHAVLLQNLFDEMYPQYGGNFCRVIDNYDPRAEDLIDDFKGTGTNPDLTIAISVDMLDTGIDVPEVVNLVFAKPIYSFVKFWQMIGRGTRLGKNLFGPGKHKQEFYVFDHWKNFEYFEQRYQEAEPSNGKPLLQRVFEARISLAETALDKADQAAFDTAARLISRDIADLPDRSISIQEKWKQVQYVRSEQVVKQFEPATRGILVQDIAPLMQWRSVEDEVAYKFDLLVGRLQIEQLKQASKFDDLKAEFLGMISELVMHLPQVRAKSEVINRVRGRDFWDKATVQSLEEARGELRGIMKYRQRDVTASPPPKVIDVKEDESRIDRREHKPQLEGLELAAYRRRVEHVLTQLFNQTPTLQKIKAGQPVSEDDLKKLVSLVLTQDPDLDLNDLAEYYPETAGHLDMAIRAIIGLDADAVGNVFQGFVSKHSLNSMQLRFLGLLQNHIARYGSIELDRLYDAPFTTLHAEGVDGIFDDEAQINELLDLIAKFSPAPKAENNRQDSTGT